MMSPNLLFLVTFVVGLILHDVSSQKNVVEVLFVVDPEVKQRYIDVYNYSDHDAESVLQNDLKYVIYEINNLYRSLQQYRLDIEIRPKKIIYTPKQVFPTMSLKTGEKFVEADSAKNTMLLWLREMGNYNKYDKPDVTIFLTGYKLRSAGMNYKPVQGMAKQLGSVCAVEGFAVVSFQGLYDSAVLTAHEIGHVMGADHDESEYDNSCKGHLMGSPILADSKRWSFSSCSAYRMQIAINNYGVCLTLSETSVPEQEKFDISSQKGRDILNPTKVCQRKRESPDGYFCTASKYYNKGPAKGDILCRRMYCGVKGNTVCDSPPYHPAVMTPEGMVCDVGKRCRQGKCVEAPKNFPTPKVLKWD